MKHAKIIALGLMVGLFFLVTGANAADKPALPPPVKAVLTNYFKIQVALAEDSLEGVPETANALAKIIKEDTTKTLSPDVARQAEAVAKAKDLEASREAFKPLSKSLIKYLAEHKVNSTRVTNSFATWPRRVGCKKNPKR